jgi:lysyl endopeptidase
MINIQLLLLVGFVFAQTTIIGTPKSFAYPTNNKVNTIIMPEIDIDQLLLEDSQTSSGKPFRYGKIFDVDYNLNNFGTWEILDDGSKLWRAEIHSLGAFSIGIEYDYFHLPKGAEFYVYSADKFMIHGAYSHINNQEDYLFATPLVRGDVIVLEYYEPIDVEFEGEIYLSEIIHDYKDIMNLFDDEENDNDRICATNTHGGGQLCPEAEPYELVINATSWLDMGGFICSGSMVNNTSYDLTKYYMTAWHCTNGDNPSTFRFYFNYGAYSCASDNGSPGISLYGSQQLATSNGMDSDWTLLNITGGNVPDDVWQSWEIFYAGWNRSTDNPIISCAIHHPNGSPKRINFDDDMAYSTSWNQGDPNTHWRVFWDNGGTQGGSSGCPLYDENFRLVGVLSGGPDVPCGDPGSYDLYGKFDRAWDDVKQWLDPINTGALFVDGTYDGSTIVEGCTDPDAENYDSDANIDDGSCFYGLADIYFGNVSYESLGIMTFNTSEIAQFQFTISDTENLITLSNADGGLAEDNDFIISVSSDGTIIGTALSDNTIPVGEGTLTNLTFSFEESGSTEVCISDHVFSDINGNEILVPGNSCTSLELNTELNADNSTNDLEFGISKVYPNPFNPTVNFDVQLLHTEKINIYVYDLIGNKIATLHSGVLQSGSHSFNWDATDFSTGLYIIQCKSQNTVSNQKVLLMK